MDQLLTRLKIDPTSFDYLLVGDGSATTWNHACGFASVLISKQNRRQAFHGGFNLGTNNIAEMMAYALPLLWLSQNLPKYYEARRARDQPTPDVTRIHVVTDSEYVAMGGQYPMRRKANAPIWVMIQRCCMDAGLRVIWHHDRRDQTDLNRFSHNLANSSRLCMKTDREQIEAAMQNLQCKSLQRLTSFRNSKWKSSE